MTDFLTPAPTPDAGPAAQNEIEALGDMPVVNTFAINPRGGSDIVVDGNCRFAGEKEVEALCLWAGRALALLKAKEAEIERLARERDGIAEMADGGARSLAKLMQGTFAARGVTISDDEAARAAKKAAEVILHAAMAGNPRDWCLSCGTVSGDGQCHCTEPFAAAECNRNARNYTNEMMAELQDAGRELAEAKARIGEVESELLRAERGLNVPPHKRDDAEFLRASSSIGLDFVRAALFGLHRSRTGDQSNGR